MDHFRRLPSRLFWIRALGLIAAVVGSTFAPGSAFAGDGSTIMAASGRQPPSDTAVAHIEDDDDDDEEESTDCN